MEDLGSFIKYAAGAGLGAFAAKKLWDKYKKKKILKKFGIIKKSDKGKLTAYDYAEAVSDLD